MSRNDISITWNSHKNYISNGFCSLQQNEEFTDMTLAAGGHFVKVHRNIIALASPYFKSILESISSAHPVIFLNKVSHSTLSYILEYIYTGEVRLPSDVVSSFAESCKELYIRGLENIPLPQLNQTKEQTTKQDEPQDSKSDNPDKTTAVVNKYASQIMINTQSNNEVTANENNLNVLSETKQSTAQIENFLQYNDLGVTPTVNNLNTPTNLEHSATHVSMQPEIYNSEITPTVNNFNALTEATQPTAQIMINPENYDFQVIPLENTGNLNGITEAENALTAPAQITINPQNYNFKPVESDIHAITEGNNSTITPVQFTLNPQHYNFEVIPIEQTLNAIAAEKQLTTAAAQITIEPQSYSTEPNGNNNYVSIANSNFELNGNNNFETIENSNFESIVNNLNNIVPEESQSYPIAAENTNMDCEAESCPLTQNSEMDLSDISKEFDMKNAYKIISTKEKIKKSFIKQKRKSKLDGHPIKQHLKTLKEIDSTPHFAITQRGTLQLLVNRFLYHSHHEANSGYKRRWRCIDYRRTHCPAFIDTTGEDIVNKSDLHTHAYPNNKMLMIIKTNLLFTSLYEAIKTLNEMNEKHSTKKPQETHRKKN